MNFQLDSKLYSLNEYIVIYNFQNICILHHCCTTHLNPRSIIQSTLVNPTYSVPTLGLSDYEGVGITR